MRTISAEEYKKLYGEQSAKVFDGQTPTSSTITQRILQTIGTAGQNVESAISGTGQYQGQTPLRRGFEATAQAFNTIPKVALDIMPQPVRTGVEAVGNVIGKGFQAITNKIGDTPQLQNWVMQHPDAAKALEEVAGTASAGGQIAGDILLAQQGANVLQKGTDLTKQGVTKLGELEKQGVSKVTEKINTLTDNTPSKIMQRVARISKDKQAKFQQMAGESVGEYLTKRGIFGNVEDITSKLYSRFKNSMQTADDELAKLKGTFNPQPVRTAIDDLLKRELDVSTPGAPSRILDVVQNLASKPSWTMSEINLIKRLYEANVKVDYLKTMNPTGVAKATNIDSAIRNWQLNQARTLGLKNLDVINKETQLAKGLMNSLGKEYAGSAGNNAMTLTDWIMLSGGDPTAIAGFLVKKGFSSKDVQSAVAKFLNKGKPIMGEVKGNVGMSQVKELPSPTMGFRSVVSSGKTIKVPKKGSQTEIPNQ